jgi:hypothetical protein
MSTTTNSTVSWYLSVLLSTTVDSSQGHTLLIVEFAECHLLFQHQGHVLCDKRNLDCQRRMIVKDCHKLVAWIMNSMSIENKSLLLLKTKLTIFKHDVI